MNKYTFEEYRKVVAYDGETEFMAGDPAQKRVREWLLSGAMEAKIRKCYDEGIPPHDVMDTIGWDDYPYETW